MTILYLTFGEKTEFHVQAYLSMLSFKRQLTPDDRIVMVTTVPEVYKRVASWADIVHIDAKQIDEWKGKHQYLFRVKTMVIRQLITRYSNDHLLFLDTDTFLYGSLEQIRDLLNNGQAIMHKDEGVLCQMKGPSLRMWKTVAGREYAGIVIGPEYHMWNSGIIGMPHEKMKEIIDDTLTMLDGMLDDGVDSFNIEQFAMSVSMLTHAHVVEGDGFVGHYWGNKQEWLQLASELLLNSYMRDCTLEAELEQVVNILLSPTPIYIHHSNTARRLKVIIDRLFPDRDFRFVQKRT